MPRVDPVTDMYQKQLDSVEHDLVNLAEAMPADKYGDFRPEAGAFEGVRTFGEQVRHAATMMYMTAAIVLEERSPYGPGTNDNGPDTVLGKAQVVEYLKGSIRVRQEGHGVAEREEPAGPAPHLFRIAAAGGRGRRHRVPHSYDHYGQMVVYARMNGVTPPTSSAPPSARP